MAVNTVLWSFLGYEVVIDRGPMVAGVHLFPPSNYNMPCNTYLLSRRVIAAKYIHSIDSGRSNASLHLSCASVGETLVHGLEEHWILDIRSAFRASPVGHLLQESDHFTGIRTCPASL